MFENKSVKVVGNGNYTANRDLYLVSNESEEPLRFFESDIKEVIIQLGKVVKNPKDFEDVVDRIKACEKNEKNNLSEEYFNLILEVSMCYFQQIEDFLQSSINEEYLKMYQNTVFELNQKITINRGNYEKFDRIFEVLYDYILNNNKKDLRTDRRLIWVMLHYMYWKCDIGEGGKC